MSETESLSPRRRHDGESYYVSITDLLLGLVFIFIILLTYFASEFQNVTQSLVSTEATRTELLHRLQAGMQERGYTVEVDEARGSLLIAGEVLFETGDREPTADGVQMISALADVLTLYLPCYSYGLAVSPEAECSRAEHSVETVVIEGHTDGDQIRPGAWIRDNWDLSAARAASTFSGLILVRPELESLRSRELGSLGAVPIFSVAGFADRRPVAAGDDDAAKIRNRRIELRIVMSQPGAETPVSPMPTSDEWERIGTAQTLSVGASLEFRRGEPSDAYLGEGWARPETGWVWTMRPVAIMQLPLEAEARDAPLRLDIKGVAFVPSESPVRIVDVLVNGERVETWEFRYPENVFDKRIVLMPAQMAGEEPVELRFEIANPAAPSELDLSRDERSLGISISSLHIRQAD